MYKYIFTIALSLATVTANAQEVTVSSGNADNAALNSHIQSLKTAVQLNRNTNSAIKNCGDLGQITNSSETCIDVTENDPNVQTYAKNPLPTCGANQVLKATGPNTLTCVADVRIPTPPVCTGQNNLQWDGSNWICQTSASSNIKFKSGVVSHNSTITPISGFTKGQCKIMVSTWIPTKTDGGYKRSRHYGAYYQNTSSGWRVKIAQRSIQKNGLAEVTNASAQYFVICQK